MVPSQQCIFLGFVFSSVNLNVSLPTEQANNIINLIAALLRRNRCSILALAQLIGKLVSFCPTVEYGWTHLKMLERIKYSALRRSEQSFNASVIISNEIRMEMHWWHRTLTNNTD